MTAFLLQLYRLMLWLYPGGFYATFAQEMDDVFTDKLRQAADQRAKLRAFGHELRHWPGSCLREHWAAQQATFNFPVFHKLSWRGTAVAALPYLLMALIYVLFTFIVSQGIFNFVLFGAVLIVLTVAWWQHWPTWSASWLGLLAYLLFFMVLPTRIGQGQEEWNTTQRLVSMIFAEVLYFLPLFCAFYWLVGRWPGAGAAVLLPPIGFGWFLHMEFVADNLRLPILSFSWLWLAVMVVLVARWAAPRRQSWVLGLAALVIGLLSSYAGQFWVTIPVAGSFARLMENFLSGFVPTLLPLVAILLLHALRRRFVIAANGRSALRYYRVLFWSIVALILVSQVAQRLFLPDDLAAFRLGATGVLTAVCLLSLLGIAVSAWRLRRSQPGWLLLTLVILFPFIYQVGALGVLLGELPFFQSLNSVYLYETVRLGGRTVGLFWLGLSAWLLGRRLPSLPDLPTDDTVASPAT